MRRGARSWMPAWCQYAEELMESVREEDLAPQSALTSVLENALRIRQRQNQ